MADVLTTPSWAALGQAAPTAPHLALYTFGVFAKPADDPANALFHRYNFPIFAEVDRAPGMIARSGYASDPGPPSWGAEVYPSFYEETGDGWSPATLSLWTGAESAFAFAYFGLHAAALRRGRDWMVKPDWPPYALFWRDAGAEPPLWTDAVVRHRTLHEAGPTPDCFTFKQAFSPDGAPMTVDAAKARAMTRERG